MAEIHTEPDVEPVEGADGSSQVVAKGTSGRKSFAKLRRELTDEELASPAVQRMLLDEIERLDSERSELGSLRTRFHETDKRAAVLEERFKGKISLEIVHVGCMTVGAAALGYAPSIWQSQPTAWMAVVFGGLLIVAGLAAKAVKP
jgi:hypothetical protein